VCSFAIDKMARLVYLGITWDMRDIVNLHKANLSCIIINDHIHKIKKIVSFKKRFLNLSS
jgi:hypothetical protein